MNRSERLRRSKRESSHSERRIVLPCHHIEIGGAKAIICTRGERRKKCRDCGKPCTKLCDFKLSGAKEGKTCDRPMCDAHAVVQSLGIDFCLAHDRITKQKQKEQVEMFDV